MDSNLDRLFNRATELYQKNDYGNALKLLEKIVEKDKYNSKSILMIAQIKNDQDKKSEAVNYYEKYLELKSDDIHAWNELGNIYFDVEDFDNSVRCYKKAIEIDSESFWVYYNIGLSIAGRGNDSPESIEEAKKWFEKSIKIKENYSPALNELGLYYLEKGQISTAEIYFNRAIAGDDKYKFPYYNLAKIYKERGESEKAKDFLIRAIKCDPSYVGAYNNLGIIYYEEKNNNVALYYYTKALQIDAFYKYSLFNIGLVFEEMEEYKKAHEVYSRALSLDPKYLPAMDAKKKLLENYQDKLDSYTPLTPTVDLKPDTYKMLLSKEDLKIVNESEKIESISNLVVDIENRESDKRESYLEKYGTNLTKLAREGQLYSVLNREKEINETLETLYKMKKNNPILLGKAGVGKTAIVEGLAVKIASKDVPNFFKNMEIIELNMSLLVAGTNYRGDFEKRLKNIIEDVKERKNIILFIDEIHTIVGAGESNNGSLDASNILKPILANGQLRCIGATTTEEYQKFIQKDGALERRFHPIRIKELSASASLAILQDLKKRVMSHYKASIKDSMLRLIIDLADSEIKNRVFPDKAIDILEKSFARTSLLSKKIVDENTIKEVVSEMAGINFVDSDTYHLLTMESELKRKVYGQDSVIDTVANKLRINKQKINLNINRPQGVFLFTGPTGVGKTLLAKEIAGFLFDSKEKLFTINMSEFSEPHSISKLIGSPPGYVGFENIPLLTSKIMENPNSIIVLEEIEKANIEVIKLFLQIFDEGKINDAQGREIYFSNTIIIMTSNLITVNSGKLGFGNSKSEPENSLANHFPIEFVNRIDDILVFDYINRETSKKILKDIIIKKTKRILKKRKINITFESPVVEYILELGYNKKLGMRNIERVFEKECLSEIAMFLYKNENVKNIVVSVDNGKLHLDEGGIKNERD